MTTIFGIGFTAPWLLLGLAALPILWIVLRAVPPAPIRRRFPGVALLLGLRDEEHTADRTPWWLLLIRTLAIAAVILGFAGPVLNPQDRAEGRGPLLVLLDGSWADASDWDRRRARAAQALDDAAQDGRTAALVVLSDPPADGPAFRAAEDWSSRLAALTPAPWAPRGDGVADFAATLSGDFDTLWLSDGLAHGWRGDLLSALEARGAVRVFQSPRPILALAPARFEDGAIALTARRAAPGPALALPVAAVGLDPNGIERVLAQVEMGFEEGATLAESTLALPPELRNRVTRFEMPGQRSAGAVSLTDDALQRREVALMAGVTDRETLQLLSPTHYLERALAPTADLISGDYSDILDANPDAIVLADVARLPPRITDRLRAWVEEGGLLVRFAGPRLAASDVSRAEEDPLMPVRLRAGGRTVGGAMSWGEPKQLRAFSHESPFFGLTIPDDVTVSAQVLAQPDPQLSERAVAALSDGTPLVTRKPVGAGQIVLFHVTASAEWSSLPLSGLFVQMLERLAVSTRPARPGAEELAGTTWVPRVVLDAFGSLDDAGTLPGVTGEALARGVPGPDIPPGLYGSDGRRIALNVISTDTVIAPAEWPARIPVEGLELAGEIALKGWLLTLAAGLLAFDVLASLWLAGRLAGAGGSRARPGARGATAAVAVLALGLSLSMPGIAPAQEEAADADAFALEATREVVLAHVVTGNPQVDGMARAGLRGLSNALFARTSVEPGAPMAVNLETDELAFFPFLYWPVTADQPTPSDAAYDKLGTYLRTGGMILFDTRDADVAGFGTASPNGRKLQEIAQPLDIPPLEPVPQDHVLTRTFYLLQNFPGRFVGRDVWVEAAPPDARQVEGMPFRDLNDNVTPVVIGGNDWASAWAVDDTGRPLVAVGRGFAGERQREIALRFGVNLIMHVFTGNYKSDQVHVPALLDRLGQ